MRLFPMKIAPFKLLKETFTNFMEDKALRLSAAIAYYSIFSLAPLLIIAISVAGIFLGPEAVSGHLSKELSSYVGPKAAEAVQSMVKSASKPGSGVIGSIIGGITLLVGATGIFGQLKDALNTIWEVKPKEGGNAIKSFIMERVLSFGMILIIGFLLLTSLLLTAALAGMSGYLENVIKMPAFVWGIAAFVISFSVVTLLFAFIFKFLPDARIKWAHVWIGAALTALMFEVGKFGLSFYLGQESTASAYGAAGSVVLLLLWIYYASSILLFGAEFTQVYAKAKGGAIEPKPNAELVNKEDRAQQGMEPETAKANPATDEAKTGPKENSSDGKEAKGGFSQPEVVHVPAAEVKHIPSLEEHPPRALRGVPAFLAGLLGQQGKDPEKQIAHLQKKIERLRKNVTKSGKKATDKADQWLNKE